MYVLQEVVKVAIVVRVAVAVIPIQLKFYQLQQAQTNNKKLKIKQVHKSDGIHSEVQNVCIFIKFQVSLFVLTSFAAVQVKTTKKNTHVSLTPKSGFQSQKKKKKKNIQAKLKKVILFSSMQ